jgi:hypothetical protein
VTLYSRGSVAARRGHDTDFDKALEKDIITFGARGVVTLYCSSVATRRGLDTDFDKAFDSLYDKFGAALILPLFSKCHFSSRIATSDFRDTFDLVTTKLTTNGVTREDCLRIFTCTYCPHIIDFLKELIPQIKCTGDACYIADLFSGDHDSVKLIDNDNAKSHIRSHFHLKPSRDYLRIFSCPPVPTPAGNISCNTENLHMKLLSELWSPEGIPGFMTPKAKVDPKAKVQPLNCLSLRFSKYAPDTDCVYRSVVF